MAGHRTKDLLIKGLADNFLTDQLKPELFEQACEQIGQKLMLRKHEGYDHSYFFIQSFENAFSPHGTIEGATIGANALHDTNSLGYL